MEQITKIEFTGSQEEFTNLLELISKFDEDRLPTMRVVTDRDNMVDLLADMVSEDDVSEALVRLEKQAEIDGNVTADYVVTMWQPLEDRYTVNQLLDEIS